jgi:hypothetical protein
MIYHAPAANLTRSIQEILKFFTGNASHQPLAEGANKMEFDSGNLRFCCRRLPLPKINRQIDKLNELF